MSERLLTVREAADLLSLHVQTVRERLRQGALRGIRMGESKTGRNEWRIPESAINEFLTRHTPNSL